MTRSATYGRQGLKQLHILKYDVDPTALPGIVSLLNELSQMQFRDPLQWKTYYHELLFLMVYPANEQVYALAKNEMVRLVGYLQKNRSVTSRLTNSGLPGTFVTACFSYALNRSLLEFNGTSLYAVEGDKEMIMQFLTPSLSGIEKEMLSEEKISWKNWIKRYAGNSRKEQFSFLLQQTGKAYSDIAEREAVFACFKLYTKATCGYPILTALQDTEGHIHFNPNGLQRTFNTDIFTIAKKSITPVSISTTLKKALVLLAQSTIYPLLKETDPFTFAQTSATEYFDCGAGISIALYYMHPQKKLELECYCGYLLLKNNIPVGYGGGWILGQQCRFGLNILPSFRGGESALLCSRLMQLFVHQFNINSFIIEPFQLGKDNAEGIQSASFWFYYKMGFRPLQPNLARLAATEFKKLKPKNKQPRSAAILKMLSNAFMCMQDPAAEQAPFYDINTIGLAVTNCIKTDHDNNRELAGRHMSAKYGISEKQLPLSVMFLLDMAKKELTPTQRQINSLCDIFVLKPQKEKQFTLALQLQKDFLEILEDHGRGTIKIS